MFVIKVYGDSLDYYVGPRGTGVLSRRDAQQFDSEETARTAMHLLWARGVITSRWEIIKAEKSQPVLAS